MKMRLKILLYIFLLLVNGYGCTSLLDEYAVSTRMDKLDSISYQQKKYRLKLAIITNTFSGFSCKPSIQEGVYYERGGCKSPVEKYQAVFEFPILSCSRAAFTKIFQHIDFIDGNSYSKNTSKYDLAVRMILSKVKSETSNPRKQVKLFIVVRFEFRTNKGKQIFDNLISGYGNSSPQDKYGNEVDRFFDKMNKRNVDPAYYYYRSAIHNAMIDVFINLQNIFNDHPNFVDNEFGGTAHSF